MLSLPVFIGGIKLKESINNKKKSKLSKKSGEKRCMDDWYL